MLQSLHRLGFRTIADVLDQPRPPLTLRFGPELTRRLDQALGTAITYLTTIDDPDRFQRSRDVGAHLGLTPKKFASGEVDRNSGISKCGDVLMRTTLYQAALALLTRCQEHSALRNWRLQVAKRRGLRRAVVAVARKLAIVMHRIWADGTEFRWARMENVTAS
jgi:hypothetical protein